jgi:nucleotide-binding universal stress UspA family protein
VVTEQRPIVVGVSGSRASAVALRWAADEAVRRRRPLHVVLIWSPEHRASYAPALHPEDSRQSMLRAGRVLATALDAVLGPTPQGDVTTEIAEGTPERALVERSASAEMLVLGSASAPALAARSIGPVIRTCLGHAHCPVVVVGPEEGDQPTAVGLTARPAAAVPR